MKKVNVCIAGGGSTFTPGILVGMIKRQVTFPMKKLVLYDNNKQRVEKMGGYATILLKEHYKDLEVVTTCDKKEAFENIDFVFAQIRTGGFKMREKDEKIPLKLGLVGQETCGPGGFAYGFRSIKDMIDLVKDIRQYSNKAWILNYTNPAAIVALALKKAYPDDSRILNICDQPISLLMAYARLLGDVDYHDMVPYYFGLNHFGWFTKILDRSKNNIDLAPRIKEKILTEGFAPADKEQRDASWLETYSIVRDLLLDFPEYLPNTYLQYYLYPDYKAEHLNPDYTRANEVMDGREKRVFEECELVIKTQDAKNAKTYYQELHKLDAHGDMIVEIAEAILNDENRYYVVMVSNENKIIENLDSDVIVEVLCTLGKDGPKPLKVGRIDTFYKGLIEGQYSYEKLTVEAWFEKSYLKALQALTLNRTVVDAKNARILLDQLIEANKDYWPELR